LIFNEIEKDYIVPLTGRRRLAWAPISRNIITVTGMPGAHLSHTDIQVRVITVPVLVKAENISDLQKVKEDMAEWLIHDEPKELIFKDEPDRVYYAVVDGELELDEIFSTGRGEITFICPDPYKYGPEREITFSSDIHNLTNNGTADTPPIFELTVKEPVTMAMIQNHLNEYMMIGKPYDVESQVPIQREERIFWDDMSTTVGWATGSKVDGTVAGTIASNGYFFYPSSYGTGTGWHGPALKKSLPEVLEHFTVEAEVDLFNTASASMIGRVEIYLLDDAGNDIAKMALKDIYENIDSVHAEARVGDSIINHYLINGAGDYPWVWNDFHGIIRMGRHEGKWFFYIAKVDYNTGVHSARRYIEFNDDDNQFIKNLAQVQIHFAQMGTYQPADVRIQDLKVYKWNPITQTEIPYIAQTGDIITFDHKEKLILINGEPRKDLKDFGASYFNLKPGENQLVVMPENAVDVTCRYRERFK